MTVWRNGRNLPFSRPGSLSVVKSTFGSSRIVAPVLLVGKLHVRKTLSDADSPIKNTEPNWDKNPTKVTLRTIETVVSKP